MGMFTIKILSLIHISNSSKIKDLTLKQLKLQDNVNALLQSVQAHKICLLYTSIVRLQGHYFVIVGGHVDETLPLKVSV